MTLVGKKVAMTGATGFVGKHLTQKFESLGASVSKIGRNELKSQEIVDEIIKDSDIIINLAGASIIARWSEEYKKTLYHSRIDTTKAIVEAINKYGNKLLISTSAVGIYKNDKTYNEDTIEISDDFLAKVCVDWENEALRANKTSRVVIYRFGIVIGKNGGALEKMLPPFKLGVGGTIGDGKQAFSFIHIEDLVNAYVYAIENENIEGAYNMCAPEPTTNQGLTKALGKHLHRPTFFKVPELALQLAYGEGASVLTDGQSVVPKKLLESGFKFKYENIDETIKSVV